MLVRYNNKMCKSIIVLVILCVSLRNVESTQDHSWDFFMFTQCWPATVCKLWIEREPSHTCKMPSKQDTWTIHGIWPSKWGEMGPFFCNKTWLFRPEEIKPIETTLMQTWTNVEAETSTYSLWSHEWSKHGTCAASVDALHGEFNYFSKGIQWLQQYSMTDILNKASILPSDTKEYQIIDFHNAIESKLGVTPMIECIHDNGKQYIHELRICIKKNLELTNCANDTATRNDYGVSLISNCNPSLGIIYPHDPSSSTTMIIQLHKFVTWLQWLTL